MFWTEKKIACFWANMYRNKQTYVSEMRKSKAQKDWYNQTGVDST